MSNFTESSDSTYPLTPRQVALYDAIEDVTDVFGPFDQTTGPDGSHYVAVSPFSSEGMICSSCAFYEGPRGCEIVDGDIDPSGICKFWIIPETLLNSNSSSDN